jgi:hypothetical protein
MELSQRRRDHQLPSAFAFAIDSQLSAESESRNPKSTGFVANVDFPTEPTPAADSRKPKSSRNTA